MDENKSWKVMCWNVRGLNSDKKWNSIRDKIIESGCDIACLQETKKDFFDNYFIKNFFPSGFDSFAFKDSAGASGGMLTIWKSALFSGTEIFQNEYALSVEFTSKLNNDCWVLTNIYAPCTPNGKRSFLEWFGNIQMPPYIDWLIVGDFNLIRKPEDQNREGGDINEMYPFNEAISALGIVELPLLGRHFTWTNKQTPPLMERLDWFFSSSS